MVVAKLQELKENQVNLVNLWELQGVTGGGSQDMSPLWS